MRAVVRAFGMESRGKVSVMNPGERVALVKSKGSLSGSESRLK